MTESDAGKLSAAPAANVIDYAAAQDHRAERTRRLVWSIVSAALIRPLAAVMIVITVPLFLRYLGVERYGLYESVAALTVWLGLTNVGMTLGLINRLTECHVNNDRETARRHVSSLFLLLLGTTAFFMLLLTLVVPLVNWASVFPVDDPVGRRETPWAVWVSGLITLWGLLVALPQSIYSGYQEVHRNNIWDGVARVATLAACVLVVWTSWGLVGVILAVAGTGVVVRTLNMLVMFYWEKPWLRPSWRYFDSKLLLGTIKQGVGLFIISCSTLAIFQTDKLVIGHWIGADAVAEYSVVGRPFLLVFGLCMTAIGPLWPAHGEALRRGDVAWVRRALWISVAAGCGAILLCGSAMFFFGNDILRLWTRGSLVHASRPLVLALTALFLLWMGMSSISVILNSANVLRAQMRFIAVHAVLNLILAVALARRFGVPGVAWSMSITGLVTSVWGYPWMLYRYILRRDWKAEAAPASPEAEAATVAADTATATAVAAVVTESEV